MLPPAGCKYHLPSKKYKQSRALFPVVQIYDGIGLAMQSTTHTVTWLSSTLGTHKTVQLFLETSWGSVSIPIQRCRAPKLICWNGPQIKMENIKSPDCSQTQWSRRTLWAIQLNRAVCACSMSIIIALTRYQIPNILFLYFLLHTEVRVSCRAGAGRNSVSSSVCTHRGLNPNSSN